MINQILKELQEVKKFSQLQPIIDKYKTIQSQQPFVIDLPTRKITCQGHWVSKCQGAIFVRTQLEADLLYTALVWQDNYWENCQSIIVVLPEDLSNFIPGVYVQYCGKTDIYDINALKTEMSMKGVNFIIYQEQEQDQLY